jgi:hypothetical protein
MSFIDLFFSSYAPLLSGAVTASTFVLFLDSWKPAQKTETEDARVWRLMSRVVCTIGLFCASLLGWASIAQIGWQWWVVVGTYVLAILAMMTYVNWELLPYHWNRWTFRGRKWLKRVTTRHS